MSTLRTLTLGLLLGGVALVGLAGAAQAHPIHDDCSTVQIWAQAYVQQLVGPFWIEWVQLGPTKVPVVHLNPGDPMSGIVCY